MFNTYINLIFTYMPFKKNTIIVGIKNIKKFGFLLKRYTSIVRNTNKMKKKISEKLTKKTNRFYHYYSHFLYEKNHVVRILLLQFCK